MLFRSAATIDLGTSPPGIATPRDLFTFAGFGAAASYRQQIAVSADGQRFLMNLAVPDLTPTSITVLLNWTPPASR